MYNILLSPPIGFLITLFIVVLFAHMLRSLSFKPKKQPPDIGKSYACGEDVPTHLMQPDYSQFFPFAFFFTVLHVVALMIATVPVETKGSFAIAVIYIAGAVVGLSMLFRR
ncbi:MAG: hypothetical protein NC938_00900 [Candidatus Omnitrophica bacterium]|nr:hypothetical protein [Candidatus Omnitrophota bacterium]